MFEEYAKDRTAMAKITGGRAEFYNTLVEVFGTIPDKNLLEKIKGDGFQSLLKALSGAENMDLNSGIDHIKSYRSHAQLMPDDLILTELSVDRTRILRVPGPTNLKPPYEGLYKNSENIGGSALEVRKFYRKAGLLPDEGVNESSDFLCIELDFMKKLCLREQREWSSDVDVRDTVITEETFLKEHLGSWVGDFCSAAKGHALTEFYQGFLTVLTEFIKMDVEYLHHLAMPLES